MSRDTLLRYEEEEAQRVLAHAARARRRGYLDAYSDLYPDLVDLPERRGYSRFPVPLPLLLLMYDQTVVYIPPSDPDVLRARWSLSIEDVDLLIRAKLIQPLIAHPPDYDAPHFARLLEHRPPSVWARGAALLRALGMESTLAVSECPLPVRAMAELPAARERFHKLYPRDSPEALTKRIELDILTNYADLWIFGEGEVADGLVDYGSPAQIFGALLTFNEVRTYPLLFGLGGTANYNVPELQAETPLVAPFAHPPQGAPAAYIPRNLDILLRGLDLEVGKLGAHDLIDLHASGDVQRLRKAVAYFENEANAIARRNEPEQKQFVDAAEKLEDELRGVVTELVSPAERKKLGATDTGATYTVRVGLPAIGAALGLGIGGPAGVLVGLSTGAVIQTLLPDRLKERFADVVIARRFSPGVANLWRVAQHQRKG